MPSLSEIKQQHITELQALIADGESKSVSLRDKRKKLEMQVEKLRQDIADLNLQIATAEGQETADARTELHELQARHEPLIRPTPQKNRLRR